MRTLKELGLGANLLGDKWEERDGLVLFRGKVYIPSDAHCGTMLRAVPESTGPGVWVGRVRSLGGRGFSERVAAPTRLSCPGFSRGKGVGARGDGE